jgi:hypothetical protein
MPQLDTQRNAAPRVIRVTYTFQNENGMGRAFSF